MEMNYQADFPVIKNQSHDRPFIYLDNAATTLLPKVVIDYVYQYMTECGANPYRGASYLSEKATLLCESTRKTMAMFLSAKQHEVIFTRGTTDSLNLIADLLELKPDDIVVNTIFEHHANTLPWRA